MTVAVARGDDQAEAHAKIHRHGRVARRRRAGDRRPGAAGVRGALPLVGVRRAGRTPGSPRRGQRLTLDRGTRDRRGRGVLGGEGRDRADARRGRCALADAVRRPDEHAQVVADVRGLRRVAAARRARDDRPGFAAGSGTFPLVGVRRCGRTPIPRSRRERRALTDVAADGRRDGVDGLSGDELRNRGGLEHVLIDERPRQSRVPGMAPRGSPRILDHEALRVVAQRDDRMIAQERIGAGRAAVVAVVGAADQFEAPVDRDPDDDRVPPGESALDRLLVQRRTGAWLNR